MPDTKYLTAGQQIIANELAGLQHLGPSLDAQFAEACTRMSACQGRVIIMGLGKSGHIGKKMAATFASTGTAAFFVHPSEALHGDLGMIKTGDVALLISYSGETNEILTLIPALKKKQIDLIAITGHSGSTLAQQSHLVLSIAIDQESCPMGLAPTTSTTACLILGHALALSIAQVNDFSPHDFATTHPGGSLGKRLTLEVASIMLPADQIAITKADDTVSSTLLKMSQKGVGIAAVIDDGGVLAGVFTDGDLRRMIEHKMDIHATTIGSAMTNTPKTACADWLVTRALNLMNQHQITALIVVSETQKVLGLLTMQAIHQTGVNHHVNLSNA